ncbi:50S ribosomal protein L29 [Morus notabilis]|uniref:Large ribosomal subunit protein uL29c n=1 Tax=Morus notabilis TaxID=981085 RepID=W9RGE3_9ROSA|nr:50S ribosomal protein L29 [Morus notabilis]
MAKRDEELKEIRSKTTEQINEEIIDLKRDLFMLRLQKSSRTEFKSSEFRLMRKKVRTLQGVCFSRN